ISGDGFGGAGFVADDVLVADVVRDLLGNRVHLAEILGEERNAAGLLGHGGQSATCALGPLLAQDADGVDGGAIFLLQPANGLFQRLAAGVDVTISDHQQHLLIQPRIFSSWGRRTTPLRRRAPYRRESRYARALPADSG